MSTEQADDDRVIIKKYANRRLYDTGSSSYITLDDLAAMVRRGVNFKVVDARTGSDLTHSVLTQIIMEAEATNGQHLLPVSFLRDVIGMYGQSMQAVVPAYLEATMNQFRQNQDKLREALGKGMTTSPLAQLTENNLSMMRAAMEAWMPSADDRKAATPNKTAVDAAHERRDDLDILKEQMAAMQKRLDELGR